jgi:hypothetical protein
MISGKERALQWTANEASLAFENKNGQAIEMIFRLFDEGLAFRFVFPGAPGDSASILSEETGFTVSPEAEGWMSPYQPATTWGDPGYEALYLPVKAGDEAPPQKGWAFPLLLHDKGHWIFISEAGLDETYCGTHVNASKVRGLYTIALPEADERNGEGKVEPAAGLPWQLPWRFVLVNTSLPDLVSSSMVYHLAQPSRIKDPSWIKPGRVSWEWWSSTGGRTVKALKQFVDLAADMGWEYSLVDAGWDRMPDGTIEEVVRYARSKQVGLLLWYNSGGRKDGSFDEKIFLLANDATRDAELARIAAMGIKGIKVDFFATDKQLGIDLYLKILRDAARHKLVVNFHGCTLPRGWTRTWPNLLTMEAVKGAEAYRFAKDYPDQAAAYNTIAAVIRGVAGPADYTPATFSNQRYARKTTNAHEMALTVVYETGLLHLADKPDSYRALPQDAIAFLKQVPVVWDETRVLEAIPGSLFVVARRQGERWYVAGINGRNEPQEVNLKLPALLERPVLFSDKNDFRDIQIKSMEGQVQELKVTLQAYGGFMLYQPG